MIRAMLVAVTLAVAALVATNVASADDRHHGGYSQYHHHGGFVQFNYGYPYGGYGGYGCYNRPFYPAYGYYPAYPAYPAYYGGGCGYGGYPVYGSGLSFGFRF
jgi:hypothetical protein